VDIHIAKLRRKIEPDPKQPVHLVTVRGGGYRLLTVA
jgi:two-component system response regulator RegX3